MNRPTAQTFGNDVSLLWLLKNSKTVYRSVLAQAQEDTSGKGLTTADDILQTYSELQDLVLDTSETLEAAMTNYVMQMTSSLVAESEFGEFSQEVYAEIRANANSITESVGRLETLETNQAIYTSVVNGQIRRGFIVNPDYAADHTKPKYVYGIAISQNLQFDLTPREDPDDPTEIVVDEQTYYRLATGQTFGLYTSTGWQYWISGVKRGWFDSEDGRMHVVQQEIEQDLKMGDWLMTDSNGFGVKYIGG